MQDFLNIHKTINYKYRREKNLMSSQQYGFFLSPMP